MNCSGSLVQALKNSKMPSRLMLNTLQTTDTKDKELPLSKRDYHAAIAAFLFCIKMEISHQKRLFCAIYYGQNNFFIDFLRKWHFFAFLAAYHLRGHLFFCSKMPLLRLSCRGYIREKFSDFGPFRAFSLATN